MSSKEPTGRRIQRVRTGCWTCRRRGYRCDETKPRCNECTRLSLECEGYDIRLRWTETLAPNGASTPSRRKSGRNRRGQSVAIGSVQQNLQSPSRRLSHWPSGTPDQTFLVQHFFYTVSSLLASTNDRSINVYCTVILPMAFDSPLVLNSVMLLSATHLATRYEQFSVRSTLYKSQVYRLLIDRIATWPSSSTSPPSSLSPYSPPSFDLYGLTCIILLSINEVFEANSPGDWVTHLTAAGKLITNYMQSRPDTDAPDETSKTVRMLQDIFAYHNVLALLSTGEQSLVLELYDNDKWSSHSGHRTAFLAAVDTLLSIAARLARLFTHPEKGTKGSNSPIQTGHRRDAARRLRRRLDHWHPPADISDDTRHTAEAMRHATLLIYYKVISSTGPLGAEDLGAAAASSNAVVQHLGHVPVQSATTASHVWPLYMAGSVPEMGLAVPTASRLFIWDRLVTMEHTRGVKSVATARQRLETIWSSVATAAMLSPHQSPMFLF